MKKTENDIIFSKTIKAGKRIYYLDVKENRKGELFLVITESKQITVNSGDKQEQVFEKHKIFLYREDFNNFFESLAQIVEYIEKNNPTPVKRVKQIQDITKKYTDQKEEQIHTLQSMESLNDIFNETFKCENEMLLKE